MNKSPALLTKKEFRDRIRKLCGMPEIEGGPRANPCVVRNPKDKGWDYQPKKLR